MNTNQNSRVPNVQQQNTSDKDRLDALERKRNELRDTIAGYKKEHEIEKRNYNQYVQDLLNRGYTEKDVANLHTVRDNLKARIQQDLQKYEGDIADIVARFNDIGGGGG